EAPFTPLSLIINYARCRSPVTGRRNPYKCTKRQFLCRGSAHPDKIMVALAEQPKGWPVSLCIGTSYLRQRHHPRA
ncbi:MAG: ash family protein, partial [Pluralibacter sp.]|nr:ash family protein [Pluralibacter sp.]